MAEATRPPERSDLLRLCAELNRLGARYIIIGGLAMNELGLVRATEDIDLLIDGIRRKLFPLGDEVTMLPGHGPPTKIGTERATNPFLRSTDFR